MNTCRYCSNPILPGDEATTHAYWGAGSFLCHKACKDAGVKLEALLCQTIDADCNDCRHFKRGKLAPVVVSQITTRDGRTEEVRHQPNVWSGHCNKFNRPTEAYPNKWTGRECFEHRRG